LEETLDADLTAVAAEIEALRDSPKLKTTPILILTTESSDQMKQVGRSAGTTGWLVKPFDPTKMVEVITKVAEGDQRRDLARRLRHRLLDPGRAAAPADRHRQDRPLASNPHAASHADH
jgi:DNA-binding response OmpR family regulator